MASRRYEPIGPSRAAVKRLVKRYGSLSQAAIATGIPYRTLQGTQNAAKQTQIMKSTAERILTADANPPEVEVPDSWDRRFVKIDEVYPSVVILKDRYGTLTQAAEAIHVPQHYLRTVWQQRKAGISRGPAEKIIEAAKSTKKVPTMTAWDKKFIATERVQPLVLFLQKAYGSIRKVSEVLEIPENTLRGIRLGKYPGVQREIAAKIVAGVKVLRHGDRTWSIYENEEPPRLATSEEKSLPQSFTRWRHAGGKTK